MNYAAVSGPASPTLIVVTPVSAPEGQTVGADVVRFPAREERVQGEGAGSGTVGAFEPEATERAVVCAMSCKVAQAALEVLSGVRSVQQLSRWLSIKCLSALTTRARLQAEAARAELRRHSHDEENVHPLHHQPLVHSVHCSAVAPGIYETSVVVADKTRFRAIAMRLEHSRGLWKVTALQIG